LVHFPLVFLLSASSGADQAGGEIPDDGKNLLHIATMQYVFIGSEADRHEKRRDFSRLSQIKVVD
jgi:hypothetical protein